MARNLKKKMPLTMKVLIAMILFYLSGWGIICLIKSTLQSDEKVQRQHLEEFAKARTPVAEVYVISLHETKFNVFTQRNSDIALDDDDDDDVDVDVDVDRAPDRNKKLAASSVEWFEAYNGMEQEVLDDFSRITGLYKLNATDFLVDIKKDQYASPHAVGCYLSHWRLLEKVQKKWKDRKVRRSEHVRGGGNQQRETPPQYHRPDMLFVFEDDAQCVSNLIDRTWKTIRKLPKDWDILYLGGKPVSYHVMGKTLTELSTATADASDNTTRPLDERLLEEMCHGKYGTSSTGPFAPGTDASDSVAMAMAAKADDDPPYWRTKYILNTNAYVINPKRIKRVLQVLSAPTYEYKPVDVRLAQDYWREFMDPLSYDEGGENGNNAPLKAYLTPKMFCDQEAKRLISNRDKPPTWEGYHWLPYKNFTGWPDYMAFVWTTSADRTLCSRVLNGMTTK